MKSHMPVRARLVTTMLAAAVASALALPQAHAAPGEPLGPPFQVSDSAAPGSSLPAVARAADGRFVVVWSLSGDILARQFAANGAPLGPSIRVNEQPGGSEPVPDVAMNDKGDFAVTWNRQYTSISARRYAVDGTPQGGELTVGQVTDAYAGPPKVDMDADGDFVVAWEEGRIASSGHSFECSYAAGLCTDVTLGTIRARRYTAGGTLAEAGKIVASAVAVGVDPPLLDEVVSGRFLGSAGVAMAADNGFIVVWDAESRGLSGGVYLRRYDAAGAGGPTQRVAASNKSATPDIATDASGGFVVIYTKGVPAPGYNGVFARRYDKRAHALGPDFRVDDGASQFVQYPALAVDPAGSLATIWVDGTLVRAQRYAAGGGALGTNFVAASQSAIDQPDVASDGSGNFVVVYRRNEEIYAQLIEGP